MGSTIAGTVAANYWQDFAWSRPLAGFDMPMDQLVRVGEPYYRTFEEQQAYLQSTGRAYWLGKVYRNYAGGLDLHLSFSGDTNIYFYQLQMPDYVQDPEGPIVENFDGDGAYPAPCQWFYATGKTFIRTYTAAEYTAMSSSDAMHVEGSEDGPMPSA